MWMINLAGLALIALIVWWFWLYKPKSVEAADNTVTILVDGGHYEPSRIRLAAGQETTLRFLRKDASPCSATLVFSALGISEALPLNTPKDICLPPLAAGEYPFSCQMQRYRGELIVSDNPKGM